MASDLFQHDKKDRKRRFLRGLNAMIGLDYMDLENKEIPLKDIVKSIPNLRDNLANGYGLEFTTNELKELIDNNLTTGDFTKKYCAVIYKNRGRDDFNALINNSMSDGAIDISKMDKAHKYGLNGSEWCDVSEGPCSCGASHH